MNITSSIIVFKDTPNLTMRGFELAGINAGLYRDESRRWAARSKLSSVDTRLTHKTAANM